MTNCNYKNIFGEVNSGLHQYRIFNFAIVDITLTIITAYIINYLYKGNFLTTLLLLIIFGIILHRVFCVKTTLDKMLFS